MIEMTHTLQYDKLGGILPAVIQDDDTGTVLMVGFMNDEAYTETVRSGYATFWSRSKKRLWRKGETSGNTLRVVQIFQDCDRDAVLVRVRPEGPTCHTGEQSCFGTEAIVGRQGILQRLEKVVGERRTHPAADSYTSRLFAEGSVRIAQKVGEEAVETILAATQTDPQRVVSETADLLYHLTVLMTSRGIEWREVEAELERRAHKRDAAGR